MGVVGLAERERERETVSLGRDIHKWIKRALILYKHIELTGDLCTENAHHHVSIIGMNTYMHIHTYKGGALWEHAVFQRNELRLKPVPF